VAWKLGKVWGGIERPLAQLGREIFGWSLYLTSSLSFSQDGERGVRFHPRQWPSQEKVSAYEQDREEHTVSVSGLGDMKGPAGDPSKQRH
jgi:hypothetical protein